MQFHDFIVKVKVQEGVEVMGGTRVIEREWMTSC